MLAMAHAKYHRECAPVQADDKGLATRRSSLVWKRGLLGSNEIKTKVTLQRAKWRNSL